MSTEFELEHETAYVIDRAGHAALCTLRCLSVKHTDTLYYDDGQALLEAGATLRVRYDINPVGQRILPGRITLKREITQQAEGCSVRTAHELHGVCSISAPPEISSWSDRFWPLEFRTHMLDLSAKRPVLIGCSRTVRRKIELNRWNIDLDTVLMPDGTALFEVEIEAPPTEHDEIFALILQHTGGAVRSRMNKHQMFRLSFDSMQK